jgi:enterochelin esterase-like enzyme
MSRLVSPDRNTSPLLHRRRVLTWGLGASAAVLVSAAAGVELAAHGVIPGRSEVLELEGACDVSEAPPTFLPSGPSSSGTFYSQARRREVGFTIAYPPGHGPGRPLPLVVVLHGFGSNHTGALAGLSLADALALRIDGRALPPMAMVAADGGNGYWHSHPGDDPMGMVINELIPMCQAQGLGRRPRPIGIMGISMGGYGALLMAEKHPRLFAAVAAISPAVWTTYAEAEGANPGAYSSAADFAANDAVTQARALSGLPVRIASGLSDPFHPGVVDLVKALPGAVVDISPGCHTGPFFRAQEPPSLAFVARPLASSAAS